MDNPFPQKAKEIIDSIKYITLATADNKNTPWNTPLIAVHDDQYNFYWRSAKDAVHSQNIQKNNKVFIVMYDTSKSDWNSREAVYIQATARELTDADEINQILPLVDKKSGATFGKADKFLNDYPRRVYKAIPEKFWINVDGEINGKFIDTRVEINLP